jgi:hypothetical protein
VGDPSLAAERKARLGKVPWSQASACWIPETGMLYSR